MPLHSYKLLVSLLAMLCSVLLTASGSCLRRNPTKSGLAAATSRSVRADCERCVARCRRVNLRVKSRVNLRRENGTVGAHETSARDSARPPLCLRVRLFCTGACTIALWKSSSDLAASRHIAVPRRRRRCRRRRRRRRGAVMSGGRSGRAVATRYFINSSSSSRVSLL